MNQVLYNLLTRQEKDIMPCMYARHPHRFHYRRHHPFAMNQGFPTFLLAHALEQQMFDQDDNNKSEISHHPLQNKANVHETTEAFLIRMDVPGVKAHQVIGM